MTASAVNLPTIDIRKHKAGYTEKNSLKRTAAFVTSPVRDTRTHTIFIYIFIYIKKYTQ